MSPQEQPDLRPATVFLFPNGQVAVCDRAGHQLPPMNGRFSAVAPLILSLADERTVFHGWPDIVDGGRLGEWRA